MCCRLGFREDGGMERFRACFGDLADPRTGNAQRHDLLEILLIALAATLCGAEGCVDMALFGRAKEPLLRRLLRLEGGIPSHDTFSRIFRLLDPDAFEASFGRFVAAFARQGEAGAIVAVDGKTARRSFDRQRGRRPLHLVSAWAVEQRLVLGQQKVGDASNEIEALPAWPPGWGTGPQPRSGGQAGAARPRRPDRHRRRDALSKSDCAHHPGAWRRLRPGAEGQPAGAVRGRAPVARRSRDRPRRCLPDGRRRPRPHRDPARHGHDVAWLAQRHDFPGLAAVAKVTATREIDGKTTTATR
jgi:hypothetical protein